MGMVLAAVGLLQTRPFSANYMSAVVKEDIPGFPQLVLGLEACYDHPQGLQAMPHQPSEGRHLV